MPVSRRLHMECDLSMRSAGLVVDVGEFSKMATIESVCLC